MAEAKDKSSLTILNKLKGKLRVRGLQMTITSSHANNRYPADVEGPTMRAEIFIGRSPTFWNVSGSSLRHPHAQHPCYYCMTLRVAFLISLPWQPSVRNIIASRVLMYDIQVTPLFDTLAVKTQSFTSYGLPFHCVGGDYRCLRHSKPGAGGNGLLYRKVYCHHTWSFADHTHRHTDIHTLFRRKMQTAGKKFLGLIVHKVYPLSTSPVTPRHCNN